MPAESWMAGVQAILDRHQLTIKDARFPCRIPKYVRLRKEIAVYLRGRGWRLRKIGEYLERHPATIMHLLGWRPPKRKSANARH